MKLLAFALALALTFPALLRAADEPAEFRFAKIFSDNMVLQRDKPITIWGWAKPGSEIAVVLTQENETGQKAISRAGRCDSFSLPDLIDRCRELSIPEIELDINEASMRSALKAASQPVRGRIDESDGIAQFRSPAGITCRAIPCDMTQMMGSILDELERDLRGELIGKIGSGEDIAPAMESIVRNLLSKCMATRDRSAFRPTYDLTVSDSMLTQINSFFGVAISSQWIDLIRDSPPSAMTGMIVSHEEILVRDHIESLRHLTQPDGSVLVISDVVRTVKGQPSRPRFLNRGRSLKKIVTDISPASFITGSYGPWTWNRTRAESEEVMAVAIQR